MDTARSSAAMALLSSSFSACAAPSWHHASLCSASSCTAVSNAAMAAFSSPLSSSRTPSSYAALASLWLFCVGLAKWYCGSAAAPSSSTVAPLLAAFAFSSASRQLMFEKESKSECCWNCSAHSFSSSKPSASPASCSRPSPCTTRLYSDSHTASSAASALTCSLQPAAILANSSAVLRPRIPSRCSKSTDQSEGKDDCDCSALENSSAHCAPPAAGCDCSEVAVASAWAAPLSTAWLSLNSICPLLILEMNCRNLLCRHFGSSERSSASIISAFNPPPSPSLATDCCDSPLTTDDAGKELTMSASGTEWTLLASAEASSLAASGALCCCTAGGVKCDGATVCAATCCEKREAGGMYGSIGRCME